MQDLLRVALPMHEKALGMDHPDKAWFREAFVVFGIYKGRMTIWNRIVPVYRKNSILVGVGD
jgi:hypothetical protein